MTVARNFIGGDVARDWTRHNHRSTGKAERIAVTKPTPPTPPERVKLAGPVARRDDLERDAENR